MPLRLVAGHVGVHALVLVGDHDVDAVGVVADVLVDPVELDLELFGVNPTAPSTPKPPALLTATTTSRQWVNAKIGTSIPSSSQSAVCIRSSFEVTVRSGRVLGRWTRTEVKRVLV